MGKHITIIQGHPDAAVRHFGHALADAYAEGAQAAGHEVRRIELAQLDYPVLRAREEWERGQPPASIRQCQDSIEWASHLVIVYPLWLGAMPAPEGVSGAGPPARLRIRVPVLKPDARQVVSELKRRGKTVCLLSGDRPQAVQATAAKLAIEVWKGGAGPEDKLAFVARLAGKGAVVAMIGDGVNDAPVLAGAHVSVAARGATQVAQAAADVILLSDDLAPLAEAVRLAQKTLTIIHQNLAWALAYNAVCVPLAALGYMTPWLAGIGMAASSLIVVTNALRLTRDKNERIRVSTHDPSRTQAAAAGT